MDQRKPSRYFLGANTADGFYSLYDGLTAPETGEFLWVIKGAPGCGKSSFMKRIGAAGESAGAAVEYVHCSGDPGSLDAVRLPEQRVAYVDGTAPHVIEAVYPGAASLYLDLGSYLDAGALAPILPEIAEMNRVYKSAYREAYALLAAGAALLPRNCAQFRPENASEKLERKLTGLAGRELHRLDKPGRRTRRFLSAWSRDGRAAFPDAVRAHFPRICLVENELGLGSDYLIGLASVAENRGYDVICCPDPLEPARLEAVLLPERELAFLAVDKSSPDWGADCRHIRLDAMAADSLSREQKSLLRQRRKDSRLLLESGVQALADAGAAHDALERLYHPWVDFVGVSALAGEHIGWLFG